MVSKAIEPKTVSTLKKNKGIKYKILEKKYIKQLMERKFKIVVGITGSSGVIYGIKLLYFLNKIEVETHVVLSKWAEKNIEIETDENIMQIKKLAASNIRKMIWQHRFLVALLRQMG